MDERSKAAIKRVRERSRKNGQDLSRFTDEQIEAAVVNLMANRREEGDTTDNLIDRLSKMFTEKP